MPEPDFQMYGGAEGHHLAPGFDFTTPISFMSSGATYATREPGPTPVTDDTIGFDAERPWIARSNPDIDPATVSLKLYGIDLSGMEGGGIVNQPVIQPILQADQEERFQRQMSVRLTSDLQGLKRILLKSEASLADRVAIQVYLDFWSKTRDYTDATGRSYFDAFLDELDESTMTVTHHRGMPGTDFFDVETGTSSRSFLDELYNMSGGSIGTVIGIIASSSIKHGSYRPGWYQVERVQSGEGLDRTGAPEPLIARAVNETLDRLELFTSSSESATVRDILVGVPAREQGRILNGIMQRHDETNAIGLGRFGEPTPQHMLYYLFENLDDNHRRSVRNSLSKNKVLPKEALDSLMAGRGLIGEYLPFTSNLVAESFIGDSTEFGAEATQWYADGYVETGNPLYLLGGLFSALWTPETALSTFLTLGTAGLGGAVAKAPVWMQETLLVASTGPTAFMLTQSVIEFSTGADIYTGEALSDEELLVRGLLAVSNAIFLGTGFYGAHQLARMSSGSGALTTMELTPGPGAGGGTRGTVPGQPRIVDIDAQGNALVVGHNPATGQRGIMRINMKTGDGFAVLPGQGTVRVSGGRPVAPSPELPPARPQPAAAETAAAAEAVKIDILPGGPLKAPPALRGTPQPKQLTSAFEDFSDLQPFIHGLFGAQSAPVYMVTPKGVVLPQHPLPNAATFEVTPRGIVRPAPHGDGTALYFEDAPLPDVDFGSAQILRGPLLEGLTPHEIVLPKTSSGLTTQSLTQMRRTPGGVEPSQRGKARGDQQEIFIEESLGGLAQRGGTGIGLRTPHSGLLRKNDVAQSYFGIRLAYEGKNYTFIRSPRAGGTATARTVPLSTEIRQQVNVDGELMWNSGGTYQPVWVFGDAPPSASLAQALTDAGIPYIVYGDRLVAPVVGQ